MKDTVLSVLGSEESSLLYKQLFQYYEAKPYLKWLLRFSVSALEPSTITNRLYD